MLGPMASAGEEPIGSMGTDTPLAVLSERPRLLYDYFTQLFAQVTNPPLDAIREELVTSMESTIGPEGNLLKPTPESCRQISITYPIIDNDQLAKLRHINAAGLPLVTLPMLYRPEEEGLGLEHALEALQAQASQAVRDGRDNSDPVGSRRRRASSRRSRACWRPPASTTISYARAPAPGAPSSSNRATPREVHHVALLIGYGAGAVNPYLAFETIVDMIRLQVLDGVTQRESSLELHQGAQQGHPQGDVEDGDLHAAELLRRADLRSGRPRPGVRRPVFHVDRLADRRRRHRGRGPGSAAPARARVPGPPRRDARAR